MRRAVAKGLKRVVGLAYQRAVRRAAAMARQRVVTRDSLTVVAKAMTLVEQMAVV